MISNFSLINMYKFAQQTVNSHQRSLRIRLRYDINAKNFWMLMCWHGFRMSVGVLATENKGAHRHKGPYSGQYLNMEISHSHWVCLNWLKTSELTRISFEDYAKVSIYNVCTDHVVVKRCNEWRYDVFYVVNYWKMRHLLSFYLLFLILFYVSFLIFFF